MKLFVAYSLERTHLDELSKRLEQITIGSAEAGYEAYAHVRDGQNWVLGETSIVEMMPIVFSRIRECDAVLLDLTSNNKSRRTGLNIELGYALAHSKPVVALYRTGDRPNMTTDLATCEVAYGSLDQISPAVASSLRQVRSR